MTIAIRLLTLAVLDCCYHSMLRSRFEYLRRQLTYFLPLLQDERHSYEKCQYDEFKKRVAKMDELRAAKDGARSN